MFEEVDTFDSIAFQLDIERTTHRLMCKGNPSIEHMSAVVIRGCLSLVLYAHPSITMYDGRIAAYDCRSLLINMYVEDNGDQVPSNQPA